MRARALISGFIVAAAAATFLVAPAQGGPEDPFSIKAAKSKNGQYKNSVFVELAPGDKRTLWLRVKRHGAVNEATLHADYFPIDKPGFSLRWFKGDKEITDDVESLDGQALRVKAGGSRYVSVRAKSETEAGLCAAASLQAEDVFVDSASLLYNNEDACS